MQDIEAAAKNVIDVAIRLHRDLGPGLLESVYETVLTAKLIQIGYGMARQRAVDSEFEGLGFEAAFRIDLVVDDMLLVEIKSVERLNGAHAKQLLTYLCLTNRSLGRLMIIGGETLKESLRRIVNNHPPFAA